MIILDSSTNSYVRLPNQNEIKNVQLPNDSKTNFWTLTSNGNNLYYGLPDGSNTYTKITVNSAKYYSGYKESSTGSITTTILNTSTTTTTVNDINTSFGSETGVSGYTSSTSQSQYYSPTTSTSFVPKTTVSVASGTEINGTCQGRYIVSCSAYWHATNSCAGHTTVDSSTLPCCTVSCSNQSVAPTTPSAYSYSSSTYDTYAYTVTGGSSSQEYCSSTSTNGKAIFNYSKPDGKVTLYGACMGFGGGSGNEYLTSNASSCTASNGTTTYTGNGTYFRVVQPASSTTSGSTTYYYVPYSSSDCKQRTHYTITEKKTNMGIRPVITIREK